MLYHRNLEGRILIMWRVFLFIPTTVVIILVVTLSIAILLLLFTMVIV